MPLEHWPHDVRLAARSLFRARAFAGTAVLTMALLERVGGVSYSGASPGVVVETGSAGYVSSASVTGTLTS